jgi:hypothetical protein
MFRDVYKPQSGAALLAHVGLTVPDAATRAWLRRMYAVRKLRSNRPREAHALLTEALTEAGALKARGAYLLSHLLELRADVADACGDAPAGQSDRKRAEQMRRLT